MDIGSVFYVWVFEGTLPRCRAKRKHEIQGGTIANLLLEFFFKKRDSILSRFVYIFRGPFEMNFDDLGVFGDPFWLILVAFLLFLVTF